MKNELEKEKTKKHISILGDGGDSVGRASPDWGCKGRGFESRQENKKNFEFLPVKKVVLTRYTSVVHHRDQMLFECVKRSKVHF